MKRGESANNALVIKAGDRFGKLTVLHEVKKIGSRRAFRLKCDCGTACIKKLISLTKTDGPTRSCGCLANTGDYGRTHGLSKTQTYMVWKLMRARCRRPTCPAYPDYGGRGIKICGRWDDYLNFLADVGERPSPYHEITRIDNDGDYTPGNVEWSDDSVAQVRNRRKPKSSTSSQYRGVDWWEIGKRWRARITYVGGVTKQLGHFKTEIEAARAYDAAARLQKGFMLNFPTATGDTHGRRQEGRRQESRREETSGEGL